MAFGFDTFFGSDDVEPSVSQANLLSPEQEVTLSQLNTFLSSQIGKGEEKFGGQLTAEASPLQRLLFGGGEQIASNILDPSFSTDVFQRTVADPALRNFQQSVIPNISQQFSNVGALRSSGINRALARAGQDLTQNLATQQSAFVQSQKDKQLSDILGLSQLGGQQRGIEQERLGAEHSEFIRTLATRNPALNLAGTALGTRAFENIVDPGSAGDSGLLGGLFSGAATAAGSALGKKAGGSLGAFFSDIRLKEDIKHLYQLENGLNVYSYKYKGIDQEARGFMAHEVEKVIPNAVGEMNGFKTVNYDMVIDHDKALRNKTWQ